MIYLVESAIQRLNNRGQGEERQSGVKFLVYGNNATGEAWTQDLQIRSRSATHASAIVLVFSIRHLHTSHNTRRLHLFPPPPHQQKKKFA